MSALRRQYWAPVALSYAAFVLVGLSAGVGGVLLPAQIDDYGVDRSAIGITFFTSSAGFLLGGATAGVLLHRFGTRVSLALGTGAFILAGLYTATRPPFVALVLVQLLAGYGSGLLESVLNAYITTLPGATTLLNRLHAFFGIGALLGPQLAVWILAFQPWPVVWLVLAVAAVPLMIAFHFLLAARPAPALGGQAVPDPATPPLGVPTGPPRREPEDDTTGVPDKSTDAEAKGREGGLLGPALREPAVLLGAVFLSVYVGLEIGFGNWGLSFLVEDRAQSPLLAGYAISGYWLGLTLGRLLISPLAARIRLTDIGMSFACLFGVAASALLIWVAPGALLASILLPLLGFCLGPLFPTTMAVAPRLTTPRLVPTAIGVMNGGSVIGGALLPWLAGTIADGMGPWTLPPFTLALALIQLGVWYLLVRRMRPTLPA